MLLWVLILPFHTYILRYTNFVSRIKSYSLEDKGSFLEHIGTVLWMGVVYVRQHLATLKKQNNDMFNDRYCTVKCTWYRAEYFYQDLLLFTCVVLFHLLIRVHVYSRQTSRTCTDYYFIMLFCNVVFFFL